MNKVNMRCGNCKHYLLFGEIATCERIPWSYNGEDVNDDVYIAVDMLDDSSLDVRLVVDKDFGCMNFESKGSAI